MENCKYFVFNIKREIYHKIKCQEVNNFQRINGDTFRFVNGVRKAKKNAINCKLKIF